MFEKEFIEQKQNFKVLKFENKVNFEKSPKGDQELKNIRKRDDGRWQYAKTVDGKRTYIYAKSKYELLIKIKKVRPLKIKRTSKTLGEWALEWYRTYKEKGIKEKTKEEYQNTINNYIAKDFKDTPLTSIKAVTIQEYINNIKAERVREKIFQHLVNILKMAKANNLIKEDLTIGLIKPKRKNVESKEGLKYNEQIAFLEELKKEDFKVQQFCMTCLILGTRRNEALSIRYEDIDKDKQNIFIRGTKTENAERTIKISKAMIDFLGNGKGKIFSFTAKNIYDKVKAIFKKLGMEKYTIHSLRHTCATNLFYLGIKDQYRQKQLGHASIVITNDIYTHIETEITKKDILRLYNNLYYEF